MDLNILLYNRFTKDIVANKTKGEGLVDKSAIAGFINNADSDKKEVATLATKTELKTEQEKITLQAFDSSYFLGKIYFVDDDGIGISKRLVIMVALLFTLLHSVTALI